MSYELTIFKNQYDNKTHKRVSLPTWDKFVELLYGLSNKKGVKGGGNSSPLISPAVFKTDSTRSNDNTLYWGNWCAVDVDDHDYSSDLDVLKGELHAKFGHLDYVVYSTASNSLDKAKFRIIFRTNEPVDHDRIRAFWYALNTDLGDIGDPQTKDLARMYFVPARYPNSHPFIFSNSGDSINVGELLDKHPYVEKTGNSFFDRLPESMQNAIVQHRKSQLNNTHYKWTSYRDCPFLSKRLIYEYQNISGTGWYHKSYGIMVSIAGNAIRKGYPITAEEIATICREMDSMNPATKDRYKNRKYEKEADGALEFAYRNA